MRSFSRFRETWGGLLLIGGTTLCLVILWLLARPIEDRTGTWQTNAGSVSRLLGYIGLALFSWAVVLAARLHVVERLFGGLDRVYRLHHLLGASAFILLLLHPVLFALRYASVSLDRAAELWVPGSDDWALTYGQIAVYAMLPALLATMLLRLRHVAFVRVQQLLGVLLIPGVLHVLLVPGDARTSLPLRAGVIVFAAAAGLAYLYHPLLTRVLTRRHTYTIERIRPLSEEVTELVVAPRRRLLAFFPGQFAFVTVHTPELGEESHPFSIASTPREARLRFVIKHLGDWTARLPAAPRGARATVNGPYGRFSYRLVRAREQIWVAGGIGIAPFLSMGWSIEDAHRYQIDLWYGHTEADDPFLDEIDELERHHRGLRAFPVFEPLDGYITVEMLEHQGPLDGKDILLCGPPPMMHSLRDALIARGVSPRRIHFEDFSFR